jgi:NAD(P)H-hydrate epimerase
LNVIAREPDLLEKAKAKLILTPHPGEMSRLINESIELIQKDRVSMARKAASKFGCIVLLKGHGTVVADPGGKTFVNTTGNPGMASGGVGDVLTGMIAAFVGQGNALFDAAALAVHLHGLAGDLAAKEKGEHGIIASDLVEKIPNAIQKIS